LFATSQTRALGPFLYNRQCAAFIELVFPLAVYQSIVERRLPFFVLTALLAVWTIRPAADSLWGIGAPVVFVHCLVDYPLREPAIAALLFAIMGALAARARAKSGIPSIFE
jgi:hypothetical protein